MQKTFLKPLQIVRLGKALGFAETPLTVDEVAAAFVVLTLVWKNYGR